MVGGLSGLRGIGKNWEGSERWRVEWIINGDKSSGRIKWSGILTGCVVINAVREGIPGRENHRKGCFRNVWK